MRIIHIASHKGNIGDIFNHAGFYQYLDKIFDKKYSIEKIELRDFYYSAKNKKNFDKVFADYINTFDLCIIGGGGFFDAQWENSQTGTTLDFSDNFIDCIKIPVIVNAMGYHEWPDKTNEIIRQKFNHFLNKIVDKRNWLVSVRNDGSFERIEKQYKNIALDKILKVPDNAFFTILHPRLFNPIQRESGVIGICVTNDLFSKYYNGNIKTTDFNRIIANFVNNQAKCQRKIIFFPHTPDDINTINEVLRYADGYTKRNQIVIAPFEAIDIQSVYNLAEYYKRCDFIIGMRFHSIIMGINLNIPTIALAGHQQIEGLFSELNLSDFCIKVNKTDIDEKLNVIINNLLNDNSIEKRYALIYRKLNSEKIFYLKNLKDFIESSLY